MDKSTVSSSQRETHTVKVRTHVRLETAERTVDEKTAASECFIRETISKKHLRRKERREREMRLPQVLPPRGSGETFNSECGSEILLDAAS